MKHRNNTLFFLLAGIAWCYQTLCIAGTNPIAFTVSPFPDTVIPGIPYSATVTLINDLPIPLAHPLSITKNPTSLTEFTFDDQCTGLRLAPRTRCKITISLNALTSGPKSVKMAIAGYDNNLVNIPDITTYASSSSTSSGIRCQPSQSLPSGMSAGTAADYIFTCTNDSQTDATQLTTHVSQTTGVVNVTHNSCYNGTSPGTLSKNGGVCTIQGTYTPSSASPYLQTVLATLTFAGPSNGPLAVTTSTTINTPNALIIGSMVPPKILPPLMIRNTPYNVEFLFSNVSPGLVPLTNHGIVTCTASDGSNCSGMFSAPVSQCINGSLSTTQACNITTTFTPTPAMSLNPITYTLTATLGYTGLGAPAAISTQGNLVPAIPQYRTLKMVNNCGFPIAYSLNGAAVSGYTAANCPPGTSPDNTTNACYWNNYVGPAGNQLTNGQSDLVTINNTYNYGGTAWSGVISASTHCTSGICAENLCGNTGGTSSCRVAQGFTQPATQAEFTLLRNAPDTYDVESINGYSIPIEVKAYYALTNTLNVPATQNNFSCGSPGAYFTGGGKTNGFGSCNWESVGSTIPLPTPTAYSYWVGYGSAAPCPSGTCITSGELCGLNNSYQQVCGEFLGYWTPNQLCSQPALPSPIRSALQCDTPTGFNLLPPDKFNNTYSSLMACSINKGYTGPTYNSCYTTTYPNGSNVSQCCGCANWWDPTQTIGHVTILANNSSTSCPQGHTDPLWTQHIQPRIQFMKQACPPMYIFPFDDMTSTFTCSNNIPGEVNTASYTITFCPGNAGKPSGATDGRI